MALRNIDRWPASALTYPSRSGLSVAGLDGPSFASAPDYCLLKLEAFNESPKQEYEANGGAIENDQITLDGFFKPLDKEKTTRVAAATTGKQGHPG